MTNHTPATQQPKATNKSNNRDMLLELVRAMARQQARQDYELMQKNETSSHIR